jgi:YfiH family protein
VKSRDRNGDKAKFAGAGDETVGNGWRFRRSGGLTILECVPLARLDWIVHGFSTRGGGISSLLASREEEKSARLLNLGFTDWDARKNVMENRVRWLKALNAEDFTLRPLRQVHSDAIELVGGADSSPSRPVSPGSVRSGDGMISNQPGLLLSVQTADCLPILLVDSKQRSIAAIHAGWRGTLQRIAMKAVGKMRMEFGTRPENVVAAVGPGIGPCCYEVGYEVAREFDSQFADAALWFDEKFERLAGDEEPNPLPWLTMAPPGHPLPPPRTSLNLAAANRSILIRAGLRAQYIFLCGLCTSCRGDLFFSYRKEKTTGRLLNSVGMRPTSSSS